MMKKKNIAIVCITCILVAAITALCLFLPKAEYSHSERRLLAKFPELSVESISSGRFMQAFEDYASDNFPLRDEFRSLKAFISLRLLNQSDNNGVYEHQGQLTEALYPLNIKSIERATDIFEKIYEKYLKPANAKVYMCIVPDKGYYISDGAGMPSLDYSELYSVVKNHTGFAQFIDISDTLNADSYYKTDTHWRQEALLPAAQRIATAMGNTFNSEFTENTLDIPFKGVYAGRYALPVKDENIVYLTNSVTDSCKVFDFENQKDIAVYDFQKAGGKDPYELFLSGSISLLTVTNPNAKTDKNLVIFRDSFASSIAPLLLEEYSQVTLADIRYAHYSTLCRMIELENSDVLFLYSTSVLNNSETLKQ